MVAMKPCKGEVGHVGNRPNGAGIHIGLGQIWLFPLRGADLTKPLSKFAPENDDRISSDLCIFWWSYFESLKKHQAA